MDRAGKSMFKNYFHTCTVQYMYTMCGWFVNTVMYMYVYVCVFTFMSFMHVFGSSQLNLYNMYITLFHSLCVYVCMQYMVYKNGYHKDHPVIKLFWTVFYGLPLDAKKKFLGESLTADYMQT